MVKSKKMVVKKEDYVNNIVKNIFHRVVSLTNIAKDDGYTSLADDLGIENMNLIYFFTKKELRTPTEVAIMKHLSNNNKYFIPISDFYSVEKLEYNDDNYDLNSTECILTKVELVNKSEKTFYIYTTGLSIEVSELIKDFKLSSYYTDTGLVRSQFYADEYVFDKANMMESIDTGNSKLIKFLNSLFLINSIVMTDEQFNKKKNVNKNNNEVSKNYDKIK